MKTKVMIILLLGAWIALGALHSDLFPMGTYSFLQNGKNFFRENRAQIIKAMQDLSYNITIIETNNSDKDLNSLLKDLDEAGIDVVLTDKCWSNDPRDSKHYSVVALATSNSYRFEAEFESAKDVKPMDSKDHRYWYGNSGTIPRVGRVFHDPGASYDHVWAAARSSDKPGWLYTDVIYRYKDRSGNPVKLIDEIRFHKTHLEAKADKDSLYLTYRIKISNIDTSIKGDSPLLSMEFYYQQGDKNTFGKKQAVTLSSAKQQSQVHFTYADYLKLDSPTDFFDIHLNISYNDLRASGLMTDDLDNNPDTSPHWWWYVLRHFAPGMYWHGNCDISLDYIDFEDQLYRNLRTNTAAYKAGINSRIREHLSLPNGRIIAHMYSMDEPFQTQLDSFRKMQDLIDSNNPSLLSASYDVDHRQFSQGGKNNYWEFQALTRALAQPRDIMPDVYPIQPDMSYEPYAKEFFLQNVLDHKLIKYYRESKEYSMDNGSFYPIVQTFGYWNGERWYSWIVPPAATQKALLMLPFCYGADGMYHYQLQGAVSSKNKSGYYGPLVGIDSQSIERVPYIYEVLKEVNPRIKKIGIELQNWQWQGATTVMVSKNYPKLNVKPVAVSKLRVQKPCNGIYEGYIEAGFYNNSKGETAIFAVNRRSNYFVWSLKHRNPNITSPELYESAYREFEPQTLILYLDKAHRNAKIIDFESNKTYQAVNGKVKIELAAGEGKLLKIVR